MPSRDWESASREVKQRFIALRDTTMAEFLKREAPILRSKIVERFYTRGGEGVNARSGHARRGWTEIYPETNKAVVVNTVPYADFAKEKIITPKKGKFLAVPIGKALTASGVARFTGPRDPAIPKLSLIPRPGRAPLLADTSGKKRVDLYFVLLKRVRIPAYTQGLEGFIESEAKGIRDRFIPYFRKAMEK